MKQKRLVSQECRDAEKERAQQHQRKMLIKRVALEKKLHDENERLSEYHLITSSNELKEELLAIDEGSTSSTNAKKKKVELLKRQINIRKVLSESIHIVFSKKGKERPLNDVVMELCHFIDKSVLPAECESFIRNPTSLIGRQVKHRFIEGDCFAWYSGEVIDYLQEEKTHCLIYEGESECCYFDLTVYLIL